MYSVGEKIFVPLSGAGIIEEIKEIFILDEKSFYYVVYLKHDDMTVMLPVEPKEKESKIRKISTEDEVMKALDMLAQAPTKMDKSWSRRIRKNNLRLESGELFEIVDIIRNLYVSDEKSPLASGERKMLIKSINVFASEVSLCLNLDFEKSKELVYNKLCCEK